MRKALLASWGVVVPAAMGILAAADLPRLSEVGKVYFWPMSSAMDQYLAEQVVVEGIFEVVVDPKLADAIMTERIDSSFLGAMDELFPLPSGETEGEQSEKAEGKEGEGTAKDSLEDDFRMRRPANRATARPRGTLFLVDVRSRRVVWSTFLKEFDPSPNQLHRQAQGVVEKLKRDRFPRDPGS